MGVFRQFPYSNFHEMNMDEIIKIVKNMLEEWAQYHAEWDAWMNQMNDDWSNYQEVMNEAWQDMQDFINNYFDNLDVQNEINNKITEMVHTGEFSSIVAPYIPARVTEWLSANITQPVGVVIDTSLSVAGACADAKATGDAVDDVLSKLNEIREHSKNLIEGYSSYGLVVTPDDTAKYDSNRTGTTVFFNCVAGTTYAFSSQDASNRTVWAFFPTMPSDGNETPYFFYTLDVSVTAPITGIGMRYSLDTYSESFAKGCQIEVGEYPTAFEQPYIAIDENARQTAEKITDAFNETLDYGLTSVNIPQTPTATTVGAYITDDGKYYNNVGDLFVIKQYAVKEGITYNLKGTVTLNITATLVAFDTDSTLENEQILQDVVETCGNTPTAFDFDYTAPVDGYLYIASYGSHGELAVAQATAYRSTRLDDMEVITDILEEKITEIPYFIPNLTADGLYISATGVFTSISDTARFKIFYIPVVAGKKYKVTYNNYALLANYGAISFSTAIPVADGTSTVLVTGSATPQNIDYTYTATANGYLCIARASGSGSDAFAFYQFGYRIDTEVQKKALKIQLFGDSITDDYWGDQRTWATLLPQYMPDYDLTIINSAVGGSGIGYHGHSNGGRYAEKTYNYVADLLTDGTLETDSDVIIVLSGTNNWAGSYPQLGVFGDKAYIDPDTGTGTGFSKFYGCIEFVIDYISTHTDALLIIVTPPQRYNSADAERSVDSYGAPLNNNNNTLRQFCDAFKVSCKFYGIPCLDLNSELGWNRINVHNFTTDGLHPNNAGDEWLAQLISSEIERHVHN